MLPLPSAVKMEEACSSPRPSNPEEYSLNSHRREHLRTYKAKRVYGIANFALMYFRDGYKKKKMLNTVRNVRHFGSENDTAIRSVIERPSAV
jgi:hypothetical protein